MSERRRYRAVMPREAWKNGREPRERSTRRRAVDDLIGGLDRHLSRKRSTGMLLVDANLYNARTELISWTMWAARLSDPYLRYGLGPAPDGSEWHINTRIEYL